MGIKWDVQADAKLFQCIMKVYDIKASGDKLKEIAEMMGSDCTPKALTHRLAKLRNGASSTPSKARSTPAKRGTAALSRAKDPSSAAKNNKKRKQDFSDDDDNDDEDGTESGMPKGKHGLYDGGGSDADDDLDLPDIETVRDSAQKVRQSQRGSSTRNVDYGEGKEFDDEAIIFNKGIKLEKEDE